jgi:hypothetical protein
MRPYRSVLIKLRFDIEIHGNRNAGLRIRKRLMIPRSSFDYQKSAYPDAATDHS